MSSIKSIESLDIHESSPRPPFQDGEPAGVAAKQLYKMFYIEFGPLRCEITKPRLNLSLRLG